MESRVKLNLTIAIFICMLCAIGCVRAKPSHIKQMIEPFMDIAHPLYYWETSGDKTMLYEIPKSTSNITPVMENAQGFLDVKCSRTATYMLSEDKQGYLELARRELDGKLTTQVKLENKLKPAGEPIWRVTRDNVVALSGTDEMGAGDLVLVTFSRKEPEPSTDPRQQKGPEITWSEQEWFSSPAPVGALAVSPDASTLAVTMPLDSGSDKSGLYIVRKPNASAERVGDNPVVDLGDFSPDGKNIVATFETEGRVELYLVSAETGKPEQLTMSAMGYRCGHPAWHPGGEYILYTWDDTGASGLAATGLSGEQLYLYSLTSHDERRLTAMTNATMHVDFAPNGDFLLYTSIPGSTLRTTEIKPVQRGSEQLTEDMSKSSTIQAWSVYYLPWDVKKYTTASPDVLRPEDMQFLVTWTVVAGEKVGFAWGPGGEWVSPENRPQK